MNTEELRESIYKQIDQERDKGNMVFPLAYAKIAELQKERKKIIENIRKDKGKINEKVRNNLIKIGVQLQVWTKTAEQEGTQIYKRHVKTLKKYVDEYKKVKGAQARNVGLTQLRLKTLALLINKKKHFLRRFAATLDFLRLLQATAEEEMTTGIPAAHALKRLIYEYARQVNDLELMHQLEGELKAEINQANEGTAVDFDEQELLDLSEFEMDLRSTEEEEYTRVEEQVKRSTQKGEPILLEDDFF